MPKRDIIVIGASAGGVEPLLTLASGLPAAFAASIFIVLHTSPQHRSLLPELLSRCGRLPATHARHGDPIKRGHIYVAPPDRHLLVRNSHVELSHGVAENGARPAVDPLFRSASRAHGPRVIGVILSGTLGDGSVGLVELKARGGIAIVQDPAEVRYDSMPLRALQLVDDVDYVMPIQEIPRVLERLVKEPAETKAGQEMKGEFFDRRQAIQQELSAQAEGRLPQGVTAYSCPACGGALWQNEHGRITQFECHVGHTYSPEVMLVDKSRALESMLYAAVRLLTEKVTLTRQIVAKARANGGDVHTKRIEEQIELDEKHIEALQGLLQAWPNPTAQAYAIDDALKSPRDPKDGGDGEA